MHTYITSVCICMTCKRFKNFIWKELNWVDNYSRGGGGGGRQWLNEIINYERICFWIPTSAYVCTYVCMYTYMHYSYNESCFSSERKFNVVFLSYPLFSNFPYGFYVRFFPIFLFCFCFFHIWGRNSKKKKNKNVTWRINKKKLKCENLLFN